jgi:hypothetical protein
LLVCFDDAKGAQEEAEAMTSCIQSSHGIQYPKH